MTLRPLSVSLFTSNGGELEVFIAEVEVGSDLLAEWQVGTERVPVDILSLPDVKVFDAELIDDGLATSVDRNSKDGLENEQASSLAEGVLR